jgi:hypothetical protein
MTLQPAPATLPLLHFLEHTSGWAAGGAGAAELVGPWARQTGT